MLHHVPSGFKRALLSGRAVAYRRDLPYITRFTKVKVKVTLEKATNVQRERRVITLIFP